MDFIARFNNHYSLQYHIIIASIYEQTAVIEREQGEVGIRAPTRHRFMKVAFTGSALY